VKSLLSVLELLALTWTLRTGIRIVLDGRLLVVVRLLYVLTGRSRFGTPIYFVIDFGLCFVDIFGYTCLFNSTFKVCCQAGYVPLIAGILTYRDLQELLCAGRTTTNYC
jgi:hypothetical protein